MSTSALFISFCLISYSYTDGTGIVSLILRVLTTPSPRSLLRSRVPNSESCGFAQRQDALRGEHPVKEESDTTSPRDVSPRALFCVALRSSLAVRHTLTRNAWGAHRGPYEPRQPTHILWQEPVLRLDGPPWFLLGPRDILSSNRPEKGALKKPGSSLRDLSGHTARPGPRSTVMGEGKRKNIDVGPCLHWGPGWGASGFTSSIFIGKFKT